MKPKRRPIVRLLALATMLTGIAIVAGSGWVCMHWATGGSEFRRAHPDSLAASRFWRAMYFCGDVSSVILEAVGGTLSRLSYDLPFLLRNSQTPEICLVYMDEGSARTLGQPFGVWNRTIHAKLVRRLTQDGARAVFFDLVCSDPWIDPAQDEDLAAALRENGRVFLGAALDVAHGIGGVNEQVIPPIDKLADAAAGWGLVAFRPLDPDYGVRSLYAGSEVSASATWLLAAQLGAPLPDDPDFRAQPRWINYYGPVGIFDSVGYDRALQPDGVPPGFFKDKVVFVGGRSTVGTLGLGKDDFFHPHTRWTRRFAPGVEIHATIFLNLLRGEWLVRWERHEEEWFALAFGVVIGICLPLFRPLIATVIAAIFALAVISWAGWLVLEKHTWFVWGVPVLVQAPLGLVWAIGTRYFLEERRRTKLRRAFAHYLSEDMADRIADSDLDLALGGEVVDATIVFTDLKGFAHLSETIGDPKRIAEVLIAYFTNTTQHVLKNKGTIIKYIGDSVFAVWGAPLPDDDHAGKAALTAWQMHLASEKEVFGHQLTTRVGVHTGKVLAGNLGSEYRFDYTLIGDAVNFASRLEGLNKYLGTRVLISDSTLERIAGRFLTRRLGTFRVMGKNQGLVIHELLGPVNQAASVPWLETFAAGITAFCCGELEEAERHMREVRGQRGEHDGPAEFYLEKIKELQRVGLPPGWTGIIELTSK